MSTSLGYKRLLAGAALLIFSVSASAQVTLYSETFQGMGTGSAPTGWLATGGNTNIGAVVDTNTNAAGINTSSNVLTWGFSTTNSEITTPSIDITGYTSDFILSFDLWSDTATNNHRGLVGITTHEVHADNPGVIWLTAASLTTTHPHATDLTSANTWQHFSIDISTEVAHFLNGTSTNEAVAAQSATDFALGFQMWSDQGAGSVEFDNITLTAVPEPASYAAIFGGMALAGTLARRRRRSV